MMRFLVFALAVVLFGTACGGPPSNQTSVAAPSVAAVLDHFRVGYPAPGALALVRVGNQRWTGHSGFADLAGTAINDQTRFRIGSITKSMVATLVLDTVSRGQLSLDSEVNDLLPGVLRSDQPVTVRMLLNHTSGIFDETNDATDVVGDANRLGDPTLRAEALDLLQRAQAGERVIAPDRLIVALAETHGRYFTPGQGFHYSNVNYQVAAMILERITGVTLAQLLQQRIVGPLDLQRTTLAPPDIGAPELRGYNGSGTGKPLIDSTEDLIAFGNGGNGGVISTAGDLLTFMQALVSGKLLPQSLLTQMETMTSASNGTYGLGLEVYHLSCGTFYGHGGAVTGTMSIAIASADGRSGAVVAVNLQSQPYPDLTSLAGQLVCPHQR